MTRSGVNPYGVTTTDLAYLQTATRPMTRDDAPVTLDEVTEAMRLAGAPGGIKSSALFEKLRFVVGKRHSTSRRIAARHLVLRTTVGSVVHGLNLSGQADRDEMGVCVEPPEYVIGMGKFDQHTERSRPEGQRSQEGDLDLVIYSLRKWMKLAMSGNPTVLLLLFSPEEFWIEANVPVARELQALAPLIVSQRAGHAFLGYMEQQRQRLVGARGQKNVKRPELEDLYGFDTKYAMHVLRLGMQGVDLLTNGKLTLPMSQGDREYLMAVRTGHVELAEVLNRAQEFELLLKRMLDGETPMYVRVEPDREALDDWLVKTYQRAWTTRPGGS